MPEYFDSSPATGMTPETQIGAAPLSDTELRRTNPKCYDPKQDWYTSPNEFMHDTDVSNRADETRLSWQHVVSELHERLQTVDWQIQAYAATPAVDFDTFLQQVRPFQRWWYTGGDLVLLTGANVRVDAVNPAMHKTASTRLAMVSDAVWTAFHESGAPKNAIAEVWDTKQAAFVLLQLRDQQKLAHLLAVRASIIDQLPFLEKIAYTIKDPFVVNVLNTLQEHAPNAPLSPTQLKELGNFEESPAQIQEALQLLAQNGHAYPAQGNLWTVTKHTSKLRPYLTYNQQQGVNFKEFAEDVFPQYWTFFQSQHPEWSSIFKKLTASKSNMTGFMHDTWALFQHDLPEMPENKKTGKPWLTYEEAPENLTSVEHAIAEVFSDRMMNHPNWPLYGGSIPSLKKKAEAYTIGQRLLRHPQLAEKVRAAALNNPPGTVFTAETKLATTRTALKMLQSGAIPEDAVVSASATFPWKNVLDPTPYLFNDGDKEDRVQAKCQAYITTHKESAGAFLSTIFSSDANKIKNASVSSVDFSNCNLVGINVSGATGAGSSFAGANLARSIWEKTSIVNCNFTGANLQAAVFLPSSCQRSNFSGADFSDASADKKLFIDGNNFGTPKNYTVTEVSKDPAALKRIYQQEISRSHQLMVTEAELPEAIRIVKVLRGLLSNRKFSRLAFYTTAAVTPKDVAALRKFLEDPTALPDIPEAQTATYTNAKSGQTSTGLIAWLSLMNDSGELQAAGLSKKEIGTLFGKSRNIVEGPKVKEVPVDPYDVKINEIIQQYQHSDTVPANAILSLCDQTQTPLWTYLSDMARRHDNAFTLVDLTNLYAGLKDVVQSQHTIPGIPTTKHIQLFPYNSFIDDFTEMNIGVEGKGQQFGIGITPDYGRMPRAVAVAARQAILRGGTHMKGECIAMSRIYPLQYTKIKNGETTQQKVWQVTELQGDAYQKSNDREDEIQNRTHDTDFTGTFRSYFRHWPETILNAVLEHAQGEGVSEVWVPEGKEVVQKTQDNGGGGRLTPTSWDYCYDRPAKAFSGTLQNVGTKLTLDPGSQYKRGSSMFYVIRIPQLKK